MLSATGLLTMWIATHPTWTLWNFITQSPETPRNTMLGATSIIALLTFVTASMASAAKERACSPEYLGMPVSTYIFSESLASRLLSTSEFSVFTLIVFIVPFAIDSITTREIRQTDINPHLFAASLWTSCFAVVSIILIVTLLTLLRASTNRLLQPSNVEWNIREAIRRQSAIDIKGHFSPLLGFLGDTSISTEEWIHDHLQEMQHLPKTQQKDYIYSAFDILVLGSVLRNRIKLVNRLLTLKHALPRDDTLFRKTSQKIIQFYCSRSLSMINSVMQSRNAEMIRVLRNPELPISLRSLITKTLMNEAALLSKSISSIKREKHRQLTESRLLSTESKLPDPVSISRLEFIASHPAGKNKESDTEVFEALTAITFRDLAYLIQNRVGLTDSSSSTEYVRAVIDGADTISHSTTRTYSLNKVLEATIYASVSNFTQGARLSLRILNEVDGRLNESTSQFADNFAEDRQNEIVPPTLKQVILDNVRSTFASYPYMCAKVYNELLSMIPDSDVRPTFLHYLTFNTYQGFKIDLDILSSFDERLTVPFYYSLAERIPADHYPQHFKRYLHSGMTGLNSEGINWLFGILEAEVDCHLYSKYLKLRYNNGLHTGFDTVLLWRIMAGDDFNPVLPVCVRDANLGIEDYQLTHLREEVGQAAKVLDSLGKNVEADKLRYSFGVPTPKNIGRSDTQGTEDAP